MKIRLHGVALALLLPLQLCAAASLQILAIGDSDTNGHGLDPSAAYPAQLQALLRAQGYDVSIANAGIDGNTSFQIYSRMTRSVQAQTAIVIYQESGNDVDQASAIEYTEKGLAWLHDRGLPTILISNPRVQPDADARALAERYGAVDYGTFRHGIPHDGAHYQPGIYYVKKNMIDEHLTALGCSMLAAKLAPLVQRIIAQHWPQAMPASAPQQP